MVLTITAREQPPSVYNRGYAASREQAMRYFKARWTATTLLRKGRTEPLERLDTAKLITCSRGIRLQVRELKFSLDLRGSSRLFESPSDHARSVRTPCCQ